MNKLKLARFSALDGWRGIAALGVAAFHFGVSNHIYSFPLIRIAEPYVDFFFVLSGFVIAHAYRKKLASNSDIIAFMIRRFGRIWPLHVFTLTCLVGLEAIKAALMVFTGMTAGSSFFSGEADVYAIFAHLAFLQSFGLFDKFTWNVPSWSIGAEFWTYLLFALLYRFVSSRKQLWSFLVIVIAAMPLLIFENLNATYQLGFFRCIFFFFAGAITYDIAISIEFPRVSLLGATTIEVLLVALIVACITFLHEIEKFSMILRYLVFLFAFPTMIFVFSAERGVISKFMLCKPLQLLGRLSYSIYMVHFVLLTILSSYLRFSDQVFNTQFNTIKALPNEALFQLPLLAGDVIFLGYIAAVLLFSSLTFRYIEEPYRNRFNGFARRQQSQPVDSLQASP